MATTYVAATADQTLSSSSTTLQNLTGLTFNLNGVNTEIWFVETYLLFSCANTTMDVKVAWAAVPSGATGDLFYLNIPSIALGGPIFGPVAAATTPPTSSSSLTTALVSGSCNGRFGLSFASLIFDGGTSGAMQFQAAQNTSDAGAIVLKKGSFMRITKLA